MAELLREEPNIVGEIHDILVELQDAFLESYEPTTFIAQLPSLRLLDADVRRRLVAAIREDYAVRFRPNTRHEDLSRSATRLMQALVAWHRWVTQHDVGKESASLWSALRARATELRDLLSDPFLRTRWIP